MPKFNVRTAYERESEEPYFSRTSADPLAAWRISGIKGPLFEQWYFDSISDDQSASFCVTFARDASYAMLLHGHLRMEFEAVFADGTHFTHADWMDEAALEDTGDGDESGEIRGVWKGNAGKRYTFNIAADGSQARVDLHGPRIKGSITLRSEAPPHYPTGVTHAEAGRSTSTELCPKINLVEVIPSGTFHADLTLDGRPMNFTGIGGHMHVWAEASWFDSVRGWRVVRGKAGEYRVSLMQWTSLVDNQTYVSGFVAQHGKKAFGALERRTTVDGGAAEGGDEKKTTPTVKWTALHGISDGQAGPHKDKSNGALLTFKSSSGVSDEDEYRFKLVHQAVAFSVNFGGGESGLVSFLSRISGGKMGKDEEDDANVGPAYVNVCELPQGRTKAYFFFCMILTKLTFGYVNILGINT